MLLLWLYIAFSYGWVCCAFYFQEWYDGSKKDVLVSYFLLLISPITFIISSVLNIYDFIKNKTNVKIRKTK